MKNNSFQNGGGSSVNYPGGVLPKMPGNAGASYNNGGGGHIRRETKKDAPRRAEPEVSGVNNGAVKKIKEDAGVSSGTSEKENLCFTRDALIKGFKMGIILGQPLSKARMSGSRRYHR